MLQRILSVLLVCLLLAVGANATTFSDPFSDNPFTSSPARWCERWHEVNWVGFGQNFMQAVNGSSLPLPGGPDPCTTGLPCSGVPMGCSGCTGICSNDTVAGYVALTAVDKAGDQRAAEIDFDLREHMGAGSAAHVSVHSVIHPNCHAVHEAIIGRNPNGTYFVNAGLVDGTILGHEDEFPECATTGSAWGTPTVVSITPHSGLPPLSYRLKMSSTPTGSGTVGGATFTIISTNQMTNVTATKSVVEPWYNVPQKGQRFGFGSVNPNPAKQTSYDNFVGTHSSSGC